MLLYLALHWRNVATHLRRAVVAAAIAASWVTGASAAPPDFSIAAPASWVQPVQADLTAPTPPADVSGGVHYLLSDQQTRVDGPQRATYRHLASKALNERGVESIANVEIRFDPSFQRLTLHQINVRRGDQVFNKLKASSVKVLQRETELETLIFDGSKTAHIFLDDVRVGDVVEYAFSVQGNNPVFGGLQFGRTNLQWGVPVTRIHTRLLWPQGRALYIKALNGAPAPTISDTPTHREHLWDLRDQGALLVERDAPSWFDPYPAVHWGEFKDWNAVVNWALPLYRLPAPATPGVRAVAERIAAEHALPGDRLLAVVRHVQAEVRYMGVEIGADSHAPSPPDLVLRRRFGDCKDKTLLTVALLRAMGIEAHPALVHTSAQRTVRDALPSPGAFNHVLVRARLGGAELWLDPTRAPQGGGVADWVQSDFGSALPIDEQTQGLSAMALPAQHTDTREVQAVFDSRNGVNKAVEYSVTTLARGAAAESMRAALAGQSRESLQKQYVNYYASWFKGITVAAPMEVKDDIALNQLSLTEHYRVVDFWERNDKMTRQQADLAVPELITMLRSPATPVRTSPLALQHPVDLKHSTRILLPSKWDIKPEKLAFDLPAFALERHIAMEGTTLVINDRYQSRQTHLAAADVPAYVTELDKVRGALSYSLYQGDPPAKPGLASYSPHWLLAMLGAMTVMLCAWAFRRIWHWDPAVQAPQHRGLPPGPAGLGGWLLAVAATLLLGLFRQARAFWESLPGYSAGAWQLLASAEGASYHPLWGATLVFSVISSLVLAALTILATALFFRKRSSFPSIYKLLMVGGLVASAIDIIFMTLIDSPNSPVTAREWGQLLGQCVVTAFWVSYCSRSMRVRATFVERLHIAATRAESPLGSGQPAA